MASRAEDLYAKLEQSRITGNHLKVIVAAILGDMLEFFDYFLIGFVLAFIVIPWKLSYGQSAAVLLSSGVGAIIGGYFGGILPTASAGGQFLYRPYCASQSPRVSCISLRRGDGYTWPCFAFSPG
jgi:hypothetical protein